MNSDIRIAVSFLDHPKTIKLQRRLGDGAVLCLLRLWCYTAESKPDGLLSGMDVESIEIASKWTGEAGKFVNELVSVGWLEHVGEEYFVHDWKEHNPYAFNAPSRKEKAKRAAAAKWGVTVQNEHKSRSQRLAEAKKRGNHTEEEWQEMLEFFGHRCVLCNSSKEFDGIVKDHIVPIYLNGSNAISNLQPLCWSCNSGKGPDTTDHRISWCLLRAKEMPAKWTEAPAKCLLGVEGAPAPSPVPSPSPVPNKTTCSSNADELPGFALFWGKYPKKKAKGKAERAWKKLKPNEQLQDRISLALERAKTSESWTKDRGQFIPYPASWLNAKGWEDDVESSDNSMFEGAI